MAQYGIPFNLKDGQALLLDRGEDPDGRLRSTTEVWRLYSKWVLGRVNTNKCLLEDNVDRVPDGAFKQPFDALEGLLGAIGFAAEAGEVLDEHKKLLFHGSSYEVKREKIIEETGDALWYLVVVLAAHGLTLEEVLAANVDKLVKKDGVDGSKFGDRAKSGL